VETLYDNTTNASDVLSFTALQSGDEVHLAISQQRVTQLLIGLSQQREAGTTDLQARLYANDGPEGAPGSLLWESQVMDDVRLSGAIELFPFDVPQVKVPDVFTWTI